MTPRSDKPSAKHVPVLDGIRGLAIVLVMFHHFFHGIPQAGSFLDRAVFGLATRGWIGVDLFFVLSGYLITGILFDAKGQDGYFRNFYARRLLRIFPAYYSLLVVFFVVLNSVPHPSLEAYLAESAPDQVWHWTYLTNFRIAWRGSWYAHDMPNVFWSLAIEEQFYLVWPLVVLLGSRLALMRLCAVLFVLTLGVRVGLALASDVSWVSSFVLTPARMDGLVVGAFLALAARGPGGLAAARRPAWITAAFAAIFVLYLETQHGEDWRDDPMQTLRFSGYALVFGATLTLAVTAGGGTLLHAAFAGRPMRFLGKYSYALYLWHSPMDTWTRSLLGADRAGPLMGSHVPAALLHSAVAGVLSVGVALASWNLVEKHFLKLKRFFHY